MKLYILVFVVITFTEAIFTAAYFLIARKIDRVVLSGLMIYAAVMIICFIAYRVEKYRTQRKELLKNLP